MRPILASVLCLLLLSAVPPGSRAETLSIRPSLEGSERYDSNVLNAPPGRESSDLVTRVTPKLAATLSALSARTTLSGGVESEFFSNHNELNRWGMSKYLELSSSDPIRVSPGSWIRPSARYVESKDAVRRNQLTQLPVSGLSPSDTLVSGRIGTRTSSGSLQAGHLLTANLETGAGIGASRTTYFGGNISQVAFSSYTANASADYRLSPVLTAGAYGTASLDRFDNGNDVRDFTGGLGGTYLLSAGSSLSARAGITAVRSDDAPGRIVRPSGRIEYRQLYRDLDAMLRASIDYSAGSFGRETKREDVTLRLSDRLSADWSLDTSLTWQANRSLREPFPEDFMSTQWTAGIAWSISRDARIRLGGELFRQWDRGSQGNDLYRESAMIGFDVGSDFVVF